MDTQLYYKLTMSLPDDESNMLAYGVGQLDMMERGASALLDMLRTMDIQDITLIGASRMAVVCQSVHYASVGGPDGDGRPRALRRAWYHWYKSFAQDLCHIVGEDVQSKDWSTRWAGRMSEAYADIVRAGFVDYLDLYILDGSRLMWINPAPLTEETGIVICVEKDSLFGDILPMAQAIGALAIVSGSGQPSFAATEKLLRDLNLSDDRTIWFIALSDYDRAGFSIQESFSIQGSRWVDSGTGRAGIMPFQVEEAGVPIQDVMYEVPMRNKADHTWGDAHGLHYARCDTCDRLTIIEGATRPCRNCEGGTARSVKGPFGLEVEAVPTRSFAESMASMAVADNTDMTELVHRLRDQALPDVEEALLQAARRVAIKNPWFQHLNNVRRQIDEALFGYLLVAADRVRDDGYSKQDDYYGVGDDPTFEDFVRYVENAYGDDVQAWRPFPVEERTRALAADMTALLMSREADLITMPITVEDVTSPKES